MKEVIFLGCAFEAMQNFDFTEYIKRGDEILREDFAKRVIIHERRRD